MVMVLALVRQASSLSDSPSMRVSSEYACVRLTLSASATFIPSLTSASTMLGGIIFIQSENLRSRESDFGEQMAES